MDYNFIYVDKNKILRSIYIFQYSFIKSLDNELAIVTRLENLVAQYTQYIILSPNVMLLYTLSNEKKFFSIIKESSFSLALEDINIACIDNGYILSSWLKKL